MDDSDSETLIYGSPTLPDVVATVGGSASFIHSFPHDWLAPAERPKRVSASSSTPSLTTASGDLLSTSIGSKALASDAPLGKSTKSGAPATTLQPLQPAPSPSPPRMVYRRSATMEFAPSPAPRRPKLLPANSLYSIRNVPLSAPAYRTSYALNTQTGSLAERPKRAWTAEDSDTRAFASTQERERSGSNFLTGRWCGATGSDKTLPPLPPPPPFFFARVVSDPTGALVSGHENTPLTPRIFSPSHNGSTVDLSDTASTISISKKNKLKLTVTRSIPRAISKHVLRKHLSGDLSTRLVADESFSCVGSESAVDIELVNRQNAPLQAVPDSFKRLFTPPNSAPPVPPLLVVPLEKTEDATHLHQTKHARAGSPFLVASHYDHTPLPRSSTVQRSFSHSHPLTACPMDDRIPNMGETHSVHSPAVSATSKSSYGSSHTSSSTSLPQTPDFHPVTPASHAILFAEGAPVRRKRDGLVTAPGRGDLRAQWCDDNLLAHNSEENSTSGRMRIAPQAAMSENEGLAEQSVSLESIAQGSLHSSTSSGSDLGLDKLMWPVPPARSVLIDTVPAQGRQELSPKPEALPSSPPSGRDALQGARACVLPSPIEDSFISLTGAQLALARAIPQHPPRSFALSSPPNRSSISTNMSSSTCPVVTVTMPSQRFDATLSVSSSPERLSPKQHPFKPRQTLPSPSNARTHTYKAGIDTVLPAKLFVNRDDKIAIDASKWSELVAYCRENEDTIIRATSLGSPQCAEHPGIQRLQVCVWEVGDYNTNGEGEPDINDPKSFGVQMTLAIRPEAPRIDTLLAVQRARNLSPSSSASPGSVYSSSPHASSAESLHSPSWLSTPPLSLNASTSSSSWASSAPPSVLFSDGSSAKHTSYTSASALDSSIQASALSMARKMQFTPLTSPNGSMIGLANIGIDGFPMKPMAVPFSPDELVPSSPEYPPRGRTRTRMRMSPRLQSQGREPSPPRASSHALKRELILNLSVPMPTLLGQIINVASQRSFGDGVNVPF